MRMFMLLCLCSISLLGSGQERVRPLEFEIGGGVSLAARNGQRLGAGQFVMELRNNFASSHFDWGVQFCVTGTMGDEDSNGFVSTGKLKETGTYLLPVFDYNFRQGKKVSYFIGSGLGMMISRINSSSYGSLSVMPRIGMELFHHLRLTVDYKWNPRGEYNYGGINVGFVLGGGRLKH